MTALRDAIDYTTLGWVKPELDETLRLARLEIEGFAEDPADTSRMRFCASYLHQVQGTLRMVELYAPAMVAEEMERLAHALQQQKVDERDAACATLMRSVVLLPDYLERLQSGHKDIPIVLLPLLNELRAARGETGLSESVLFVPDLARPLPADLPQAPGPAPTVPMRNATAAPLLARLRLAMAGWPEAGSPADRDALVASLDALLPHAPHEAARRLLWVATSIAKVLRDGGLDARKGLQQAFAGVEREARRMFEDDGFGIPREDAALEPTRQLLYHVAHGGGDHPLLRELRATFDLDALQPTASEISHAQGSLSGRNRALLDTVAAAVKEDLLRVKDALDLHLRTGRTDLAELQPQAEALGRVADTLGMLGLGVARNVVQEQRVAMDAIVRGDRAADEGALLDVAGALLYVDASLDDQVARLGTGDEAPGDQDDLFSTEARKVLEVVVREAIANFADARQAFVAFVETNWDHGELVEVPRLLEEVGGALHMLELPQPAAYLSGVRRYTEVELLGRKRVPNGRQLDTFADALASLEYYLEALRENRFNRDDILDVARNSLESLGYWPLPLEDAGARRDFEADAAEARSLGDIDRTLTALMDREGSAARATAAAAGVDTTDAPAIEEPAAVASARAGLPTSAPGVVTAGGFEATGDEIDDEIREVFLEEFAEEIDNLDHLLPVWRAAPDDFERLRPIRRVFHTLKGSGRLVGARTLGEFSWKIEHLLNRVLDGSRAASPAVVAMVDQAFYTLPQLQAALRGDGAVTADLARMQASAERIAEGDEAMPETATLQADATTATGRADPVIADGSDGIENATGAALDDAPSVRAPRSDADAGIVDADDAPGAGIPTVPASVDALLLEILDVEVAGHLATVDGWLASAAKAPAVADEALLRAIHTMNGAFAMTEVPAIPAALSPAETLVRRLLATAGVATPDQVLAMAGLAGLIRATMAGLHADAPRVPTCDALASELEALRDALPEAVASAPADPADDGRGDGASDADAPSSDEQALAFELAGGDLTDTDLSDYADLAAGAGAPTDVEDADAAETSDSAGAEAADAAARARARDHDVLERERIEAERLETARLEAERHDAERAETARLDAERLDAERAEAERLASELEAERRAAGRVEAERVEAARLEAERQEAERAEAERLDAERAEVERVDAERAEAERAEAARRDAEAARLAADEEAEYARLEAEYAEQDRLARSAQDGVEGSGTATDVAADGGASAEDANAISGAPDATHDMSPDVSADPDADAASAVEVGVDPGSARDSHDAEDAKAETGTESESETETETETETEPEAEAKAEAEFEAAAESDVGSGTESETSAKAVAEAGASADTDARSLQDDVAVAAILEHAVRSADDPDEALDLSGLDPELVDIFVEEAGDLLDHSDGLLSQLRDAPAEREPLVGLQRDLHTIKGGARMAGIMAMGELGHAMESLLEAVVEQRCELGADGIPLLERGFDRLHAMVTRIGDRRAIGQSQALIDEFDTRARGEPRRAAEAPVSPAPRMPAPKVSLKPLSAPIEEGVPGDEDDIGVRAPQEQVRIRADLLDRLVNYAGEVAIYRARLEQQLGAFRSAMGEMEQTNMRLRDQLRRLDIETEAQIIARYQREGDSNDGKFDPLELDRFSTLQQLSRALGESAADMSSLQGTLDDLTRQYETLLLQQSRVSSELQEGLMRTRMVPFDALVPRLRRVVRQAAGDTGKQVQLKLDGAQGELDRNVLERMTAPLEHMLRNAVAHGLEGPDARNAAGKPEEGVVRIAIRREGSEVVLEVGDDGAGLDRAAIRRRGEERGLVRPEANLADGDLDMLIFEPGFTTADAVSRLAGRGVGMDVVASEVRQLGGTIDIASRRGEGTRFTLRLPQTLAVTQAVFVRIGDTSFAVPIASVRGVGRVSRGELAQPGASYAYGGEDYAIHDLGGLVGQGDARAEGLLQMPVLLIRSGDLRAAVVVDQIVGNREIVVKPVGPQVASVPGIFGATIMGDGRVVVILDVAPLVRRQAVLPRGGAPEPVAVARRVPLVMVVDDSVTMRKVTGRVLERHNLEVGTAKDGIDALERMVDRVPDLMLLDIEMPRMDGYELAEKMKADPRLRDVPIVMITSRTGEKHRQRAFEIGVERYLGKPYQENELMRNVYDLLKMQPEDE